MATFAANVSAGFLNIPGTAELRLYLSRERMLRRGSWEYQQQHHLKALSFNFVRVEFNFRHERCFPEHYYRITTSEKGRMSYINTREVVIKYYFMKRKMEIMN